MNSIEATTNIIIAMINNKFLSEPEEISSAYSEIYKTIKNPENIGK